MFVFIIKPKNGQPDFGTEYNSRRFRDCMRQMEGKDVRITIEPENGIRSQNIHRFYWTYMTEISKQTGDDPNSLHELFKRKLLPPRFEVVMGKELRLPATTTLLSGTEMAEYIDRISEFCGIQPPDVETWRIIKGIATMK